MFINLLMDGLLSDINTTERLLLPSTSHTQLAKLG
jgi:hypothetical protein